VGREKNLNLRNDLKLKEFRDFILRGNVIDLAVAVIIGTAFNQVVNSMVSDLLTPIIGALSGNPDFSSIKIGPVYIGKFISGVVNFLIVSAVIFFVIIKPMRKIQERRKKEEEQKQQTPPEPPEVKLLREILQELKKNM